MGCSWVGSWGKGFAGDSFRGVFGGSIGLSPPICIFITVAWLSSEVHSNLCTLYDANHVIDK